MHETSGHPLPDHVTGRGCYGREHVYRLATDILILRQRMEVCDHIVDEPGQIIWLFEIGEALEAAEADVTV